MKKILFVMLGLIAFSSFLIMFSKVRTMDIMSSDLQKKTIKKSLKEQILAIEGDNGQAIKNIQILNSPESDGLFIVIAEEEKDWFESLWVIKIEDNTVKWKKTISQGHDFMNISLVKLEGFDHSLVEVYEKNHQGNGDYMLYEINKNGDARLLIDTFAVDIHMDEWPYQGKHISPMIRDKKLSVVYKDINNDGFDDIILEGHIDYFNDDIDKGIGKLIASGFWNKVFLYDKIEGKFIWNSELSYYRSNYEFITYYVSQNL